MIHYLSSVFLASSESAPVTRASFIGAFFEPSANLEYAFQANNSILIADAFICSQDAKLIVYKSNLA